MLNTVISYSKNNYYHNILEKVTLDDDSKIFNNNGKKVKLYWAYYLIYGKTWYEAHCGAQPATETDNKLYLMNINKLNTKIQMSWKEFSSFCSKYYIKNPEKLIEIETIFSTEKEKGSYWNILFKSLASDIIYNCLGENLSQLCGHNLNLHIPTHWQIILENYTVHNYILTKVDDSYISNIEFM